MDFFLFCIKFDFLKYCLKILPILITEFWGISLNFAPLNFFTLVSALLPGPVSFVSQPPPPHLTPSCSFPIYKMGGYSQYLSHWASISKVPGIWLVLDNGYHCGGRKKTGGPIAIGRWTRFHHAGLYASHDASPIPGSHPLNTRSTLHPCHCDYQKHQSTLNFSKMPPGGSAATTGLDHSLGYTQTWAQIQAVT